MDNIVIKSELQKYNITDEAIANMSAQFMPLVVAGIEDRVGLATVHAARMTVKNKRIEVEKTRKSLKEDSLAFGRLVDGEAKRITALLAPIEAHLDEEEGKIERIKAAIEAEKNAAEAARLKAIDDERLAKIEAARVAEEARLDAIRAEQEAERARLDAEQAAIRAEREKLEADRRAIEAEKQKAIDDKRRADELETARKEAVEQARIDAEAKAERDRIAEVKDEEERKEAARIAEQERPDKEKLLAFAAQIVALQYPVVTGKKARTVLASVEKQLGELAVYIRNAAAK
jgi:hypothetical protein